MRALHLLLGSAIVGVFACTSGVSEVKEGSASTSTSSSTGTGGGAGSPSTTSTSTAPSTTGGGGGAPGADSIAILDSALPASVHTADWPITQTLDPSTLILAIDTLGEACGSLRFDVLGPDNGMSYSLVVVGLPTALQTPGTYSFSSTDVIAWGSWWNGDGMGSGMGGQMAPTGSIEVVSIDASTVAVSLTGLSGNYTVLEGPHTAARCP